MKNRILAQILILCVVFSALPVTAWATPEVIPSPYMEDVRDDGQIPADKFLTVIATSNDLYITSIALIATVAGLRDLDRTRCCRNIFLSAVRINCFESYTGDVKIIASCDYC